MKLRAQADGSATPMSFGARALHPLDQETQLVVIGVANNVAPRRFDVPRMECGVITRAVPVVNVTFWVGFFSDEVPAEESLRSGIEELVASPAWRQADARLVGAGDPEMPRVVRAGTNDFAGPPEDPLRGACWILSRESSDDTASEAAIVYGRMVPNEGDTYSSERVATYRRKTAEGDVLRVIGVSIVTLRAGERAVGLAFEAQSEAGEAWKNDAERALQAVLTGSYLSQHWLLAPEGA
jgi:hypothetical protein